MNCKAFGHFFNDTSACANKIRMAIELTLDDLSVKRTVITKFRRGKELGLHSRIDIFISKRIQLKELGERMLAPKWIGNDGSHVGQQLTQGDLLVGFELIEDIIKKLYDDSEKRLGRIVKEINTKRGITPKRKRKASF